MENQDGAHGTEREEQTKRDDPIKDVYPEQERDIILNNELNLSKAPEQNGFLDLIYGTLFDPARTFAAFARNPRIGAAVLIFISLNLLEALMGYYTTPRFFQSLHLPGMLEHGDIKFGALLVAWGGFLFSAVKWFVMSGLLHLLAELFGGKGNVRSVFAVYGVAGLPVIFMIPVQVMLMVLPQGLIQTFAAALFGIAVFIWSTVLLVIGLREVYQISTGKAALVVITPVSVLAIVVIISTVMIGVSITGSPTGRFI